VIVLAIVVPEGPSAEKCNSKAAEPSS
jgi:hypothetical protein